MIGYDLFFMINPFSCFHAHFWISLNEESDAAIGKIVSKQLTLLDLTTLRASLSATPSGQYIKERTKNKLWEIA